MKNTNNNARAALAAYINSNPSANFLVCGGEVWHKNESRVTIMVADFGHSDDPHLAAMISLRELRQK